MQHELEVARQVEEGDGTRYIRIPEEDSHEAYRDMERFISTVRDDRLRDQLWRAVSFQSRCLHERITRWLESEGIEPANPKEPPEVPEPEAEDDEAAREALLEDLTLLVIYLSSWEEELAPDRTIRQAWKGYLFEVLNALEEKGYISQTRRAKSMTLTEAGVERAQEIAARYED